MTNVDGWTPDEVALHDQVVAYVNDQIDELIAFFRVELTKSSEHQAMAELGTLIDRRYLKEMLSVILTAAIKRLAEVEDAPR